LKRQTEGSPSGSGVVKNGTNANKVLSLKKITQLLSILFANGIFRSE
jgi:hypothetical protein